jgi:hypothetical protein
MKAEPSIRCKVVALAEMGQNRANMVVTVWVSGAAMGMVRVLFWRRTLLAGKAGWAQGRRFVPFGDVVAFCALGQGVTGKTRFFLPSSFCLPSVFLFAALDSVNLVRRIR